MGGGVNPPVVTLVEPEDPEVSDLIGAERMFTASCDQSATLTFYLDGDLVYTSSPGVQQASYTFPSAPLGLHVVRVVAVNENGTGENYWNWNVYQYGDCHVPAGAYLDFFIGHYRCGLSDCEGGSGSWNNAVCLPNAVMRYARAGKSTPYIDILAGCYWMKKIGCPEHCYVEQIFNLDIYSVAIVNGSLVPSFGHAVGAEYLGGDMNTFSSWRFFQYDNLNITPGDWQMPYGSEWQDTKVKIFEVIGIPDCGHYNHSQYPVVTFMIDENGNVTLG
jgi:hypothetical protein